MTSSISERADTVAHNVVVLVTQSLIACDPTPRLVRRVLLSGPHYAGTPLPIGSTNSHPGMYRHQCRSRNCLKAERWGARPHGEPVGRVASDHGTGCRRSHLAITWREATALVEVLSIMAVPRRRCATAAGAGNGINSSQSQEGVNQYG
jgi:hypothetical protein